MHVLAVDEHGRMNSQKASGYNTRSKVEAAISRYKRVIGDTLKSRHDTRRATEVAIAIKSLNRMNQLGRAIFTHDRSRLDVKTRLAKPPCNKVSPRGNLFLSRDFMACSNAPGEAAEARRMPKSA